MKTSSSQFYAMVEYMERHGDLNKLGAGPEARLRAMQLWEDLTNLLNLDVTGDTKDRERWKKVWSDFKANIKRKAAKIHQAATGSDGGTECKLALTDLEQRVLLVIGPQVATGLLNIKEVGIKMSTSVAEDPLQVQPLENFSGPSTSHSAFNGNSHIQALERITPDRTDPRAASPSASSRQSTPELKRELSETRQTRRRRSVSRYNHSSQQRPTPRLNTTQRQRRGGGQSPRTEDLSSHFRYMDQRWRLLAREVASEHMRLRARELEQRQAELELRQAEHAHRQAEFQAAHAHRQAELSQRTTEMAQWQNLMGQFLHIFNNFVNK